MDSSQSSRDAPLLHRRVKRCSLDVHPSQDALVLDYELEATVLGEMGDATLGERSCRKIIRVKSLSPDTDTRSLACRVLEGCSLIHPSSLREVEQLLFYLKNRNQNHEKQEESTSAELTAPPGVQQQEASLSSIEQYVELLYEDVQDKLRGASLILQLSLNQDNLQELIHNEAVLGALARVLREDWRHSVQLSTTILSVFYCFSRFSQFQPVVSQYKVGALCVTMMEQELGRFQLWTQELQKKVQACQESPQDLSLKKDHEKSERKYQSLVQKQDQLLTVAVSLLLNLSEDVRTELKMRNKNIVSMLVTLLDRDDPELLQVSVSFLKKLSIFMENKNDMVDCAAVQSLVPLVRSSTDSVLLESSLKLLLNLSFDSEVRTQMVQAGLVPQLCSLIGLESHRELVLCVLYHLSLSDHQRALFSHTDCIPQLMQLLSESPQDLDLDLVLVSLCINLSLNQDNAQLFCSGCGLKKLMRRALRNKDVLLMKIIRNLSQHQGPTQNLLLEHLGALVSQISEDQEEDFVLEVLGTVSNLRLPDLDWALVLEEFSGLLHFLLKRLTPDRVEDDLVLEVVLMIGTLSMDESCASVLSRSGVVPALIQLLNARQSDDEFVCQILFVFYQMVFHKETRDDLLRDSQASVFLINLMHDTNPEICRVCDLTLDIIADYDETWFKKVQMERFRRHNDQWLEMVQNQDLFMFSEDPEEDLYYSPPDGLLSADLSPQDFFSEFQHMDLGHVLINSVPETFAADGALTSFGLRPDEGFFLNFTNASR